jgi:hypothetical protein
MLSEAGGAAAATPRLLDCYRRAFGPAKRLLRATSRLPTRLPSSKNPVFDFARVSVAWAAPSDSSLSALVLRLLMVSQAWW